MKLKIIEYCVPKLNKSSFQSDLKFLTVFIYFSDLNKSHFYELSIKPTVHCEIIVSFQ